MAEILFVSNDPRNTEEVAGIVAELGHDMTVCFSTKQACSTLCVERHVDVVVIDCSGVQSADESVAEMLQLAKHRSTPVIAMVHPNRAYAANGSPGESNTLAEEINYAILLRDIRTLNVFRDSPTEQMAAGV